MTQKLNKWQRELLKLEKQSDKNLNRKLYNVYNEALREVRGRLRDYMDEFVDLPYYKQQEAGKLSALEKEIVELLNQAQPKAGFEITEFKQSEMVDGYYSSMYQIEGETGASLDFMGLDKEFIRQSVAKPIAGKTLSQRLYKYRDKLARRATSEVRNGLTQGKTYAEIAGAIKRHTEANYAQAVRIARTEGGRLRSMSKQVAYEEAKDLGIDIKKRWYSSLDSRTRSSHRELDGQTVEIDEKFKYGGHEADGPRLFGKANLDINCRCTTITIVDGIEPGTRLAKGEKLVNGKVINEYGSIPYKDYVEWKDKRITANDVIMKSKEMSNKFKDVLKDVDFTKSRRSQAKQVLKNLGLEDVPVSVKKAGARGYCRIDIDREGKATIIDYVLESTDDRSSEYRTKTLFHEAYHAMGHDRLTDMRSLDYGSIRWLDIEETFAETSAHYASIQAGINEKLSPAYSEKLVNILPRLKQMDKFKRAKTISDFGEIAWSDRLNGTASTWLELAKEVEAIDHDWIEYSKQYKDYIIENRDKLMDKMLENMPSNKDFKDYMLTDLNNALDKIDNDDLTGFTGNENMVYSNILVNAMNEIGVK